MNNTTTRVFCQTKTGNKIHATSAGSSRTDCGAKVARRLTHMGMPHAHTVFCGGCGLNGDVIVVKARACAQMFSAFHELTK